jgi:hypothetical protein
MFKNAVAALAAAIALCLFLLTPSPALADLLVTGSGMVEGKDVSAQALFSVEVVNSDTFLKIVLANSGTRTDYTMAQVLTDIEFDLSGVSFVVGGTSGSSVKVGLNSILSGDEPPGPGFGENQGGPGTDLSPEWVYGTNVTVAGGFGPFDFGVSATAFINMQPSTQFAAGNLSDSSAGVDGGDFGLINSGSRSFDGLPNADIVTDDGTGTPKVVILLKVASGTLNLDNLGDVVFTYGSAQESIPGDHRPPGPPVIPEPSTIVLSLIGLAGCGFAGLRRLRRKSA